jgi:hypothetical protein
MATTAQTPIKPGAKDVSHTRSFMRDDFPAIRMACIIFLICTLSGAALVAGSQYLVQERLDAENQAQAQDNQTREKRRQAENEKHEILDFQPKYQQLASQGIIGAEKRLDWIEKIQSVQKKDGLQPINYDIAEQQVFQVDPTIDTGSLELRGSKMLVKMNLLHEVDLLAFFDDLKSGQFYDLQRCTITRLPDVEPGKFAPLLSADCTLYWITIGKRGGDNPDPSLQAGP